MRTETLIRSMNTLIRTNMEAHKGYKRAAKNIADPEISTTLETMAEKHQTYATDLSEVVDDMGGKPRDRSTMLGKFHDGWRNLEALLTNGDASMLIDECVKGEKAAIKNYREALRHPIPDGIIEMVWDQYDTIKATTQKLEVIRNDAI